jgi:hypothetical protein
MTAVETGTTSVRGTGTGGMGTGGKGATGAGAGGTRRCMIGNGMVSRARRNQYAREALVQSLIRPFPVRGPGHS